MVFQTDGGSIPSRWSAARQVLVGVTPRYIVPIAGYTHKALPQFWGSTSRRGKRCHWLVALCFLGIKPELVPASHFEAIKPLNLTTAAQKSIGPLARSKDRVAFPLTRPRGWNVILPGES
jgi:hypothetical protein